MTPADFFDALLRGEYAMVFPNLHTEKLQDLVDDELFYTTSFAKHMNIPDKWHEEHLVSLPTYSQSPRFRKPRRQKEASARPTPIP
jgi:hypothetical protein